MVDVLMQVYVVGMGGTFAFLMHGLIFHSKSYEMPPLWFTLIMITLSVALWPLFLTYIIFDLGKDDMGF